MLIEEIRRRMTLALKAGKATERQILGLALGEIQTSEARGGGAGDEVAAAIVRKIIKSNEETLALAADAGAKATLAEEVAVLRSLLPATLDPDGIVAALSPVRDAVRAAANDGQATGVAMKQLKAAGAAVSGKDVALAVKRMRE